MWSRRTGGPRRAGPDGTRGARRRALPSGGRVGHPPLDFNLGARPTRIVMPSYRLPASRRRTTRPAAYSLGGRGRPRVLRSDQAEEGAGSGACSCTAEERSRRGASARDDNAADARGRTPASPARSERQAHTLAEGDVRHANRSPRRAPALRGPGLSRLAGRCRCARHRAHRRKGRRAPRTPGRVPPVNPGVIARRLTGRHGGHAGPGRTVSRGRAGRARQSVRPRGRGLCAHQAAET